MNVKNILHIVSFNKCFIFKSFKIYRKVTKNFGIFHKPYKQLTIVAASYKCGIFAIDSGKCLYIIFNIRLYFIGFS